LARHSARVRLGNLRLSLSSLDSPSNRDMSGHSGLALWCRFCCKVVLRRCSKILRAVGAGSCQDVRDLIASLNSLVTSAMQVRLYESAIASPFHIFCEKFVAPQLVTFAIKFALSINCPDVATARRYAAGAERAGRATRARTGRPLLASRRLVDAKVLAHVSQRSQGEKERSP